MAGCKKLCWGEADVRCPFYKKDSREERSISPGQADQALACMSIMEFEGKDQLMQQISYNGTMQKKLSVFQQYALAMTQKYEPERAGELMSSITGDAGMVEEVYNSDLEVIENV